MYEIDSVRLSIIPPPFLRRRQDAPKGLLRRGAQSWSGNKSCPRQTNGTDLNGLRRCFLPRGRSTCKPIFIHLPIFSPLALA
jgi:hypothetical protein